LEKIQTKAPWLYLGWKISDSQIHPQKLQLNTSIKTLHDAQRLMGDIQWIRPVVGISNAQLDSLRPLLRGTDPTTPVQLTSEQQRILSQIADQIASRFVHRRDPDLPIDLCVFLTNSHLLGALSQFKKKKGEVWGDGKARPNCLL